MPDIGFLELMLVGLLAFLILGPERLPEFFAQIGRMTQHARSWLAQVKEQINTQSQEIQQPLHDVGKIVDESIQEQKTIKQNTEQKTP